MSNKWLTPQLTPTIPLAESINSVLDPVIGVLKGLLDITAAILDILAFLTTLSADPLLAAMEALFNMAADALDTLVNMAFTVFIYEPQSWDEETAGGYAQFLATLEASLDDPGDLAKPRLKPTTPFFALAVGAAARNPLELMPFVEKFASFVTEKFNSIQNAIFTYIPQAPGLGVVTGLEATSNDTYITVSPGKFLQKDTNTGSASDGIVELFTPEDVFDFEANKAYALVIFNGELADENGVFPSIPYTVAAPIGDVTVTNPGTENETRTVNRDISLLASLGFSTVFLAYFETDTTGRIVNFNPNYRKVLANMTEDELRDKVKQEKIASTKPDWYGWSIRSIKWFEPLLQSINEARRKGQPQASLNDSLTQLKELTQTISQGLDEVSEQLKEAASGIQSGLEALASASVLFVTPWPSITSGKDTYRLSPNESFTLQMDPLSQSGGAPNGLKTFTFTGTSGSYTGIDNINFSIPAGTKFWMDTYLRRSRPLPGGTLDATLGLVGGVELPKGEYVGTTDSRFFRIPNAGADFKINTYGKGLEILSGPNSLHNLLNLPLAYNDSFSESSDSVFNYHYPNGASLNLSLWSKNVSVYNTSNSILGTLGLNGSTYDPGLNKIEGVDSRTFKVPSNTGCRISTYTNRRSYLTGTFRTKVGFDSYSSSSDLDTGTDARKIYISGMGGYRVTLGIRSLFRTPSSADAVLGLTNVVNTHGKVEGENALKFSYPAISFNYSTYVNKISSISGEIMDLVGWSVFPSAKGSILSGDRRSFSWPLNAGFNISVRNNSGVIFSGQISIIVAGSNRNGIALANQVTFALRQLPGSRGIETCTFEPTGLFKFYFGNDVLDATFSPHTNPGRDILNSLGMSPGVYVPVSNFIDSGEPLIYRLSALGDFTFKLGKNTYTNYIPQGLYTGSSLAALLETAIQTSTSKNEQVTYNPSNGRFNLTLDPIGYISTDNQNISLSPSSLKDPALLAQEINSGINKEDNTESFIWDFNNFKYYQDGLVSINFLSGTALSVLGLNPGLNTASMQFYTGDEVKNLYLPSGSNILQLVVNKSPLVIPITPDTNLSFADLVNFLNTNYTSITSSFASNKLSIESNSVLNLISNYLFFYPSAYSDVISSEILTLKSKFDTALGDSLTSISFSEDAFSISYPDLEELTFTPPGIGIDLRTKYGWVDATGLNTDYTGSEANIFEIDVSDSLGVTLGSDIITISILPGEYSGTSLAQAISNEVATLAPVYPTVEYSPTSGMFTFSHDNSGYLQIDNKLLTLSPAPSQSGINVASDLQASIRLFPDSLGTENCIFIADKFLFVFPGLKKIVFTQEPGYYSLPVMLGYSFNTFNTTSGRVEGGDPYYYFVDASNNNFDYGLSPTIVNVVIPNSTDFESGTDLASRVQTALNTATGNSESVSYNTEDGIFSVQPDPEGFSLLSNQDIVLASESGYITPEDLASRVQTVLGGLLSGSTFTYEGEKFKVSYPGLAKLDIALGPSGLKLSDMVGFGIGLKSNLNSEFESDMNIKYLAFHSDASNLHIKLGGVTHNISYVVDGDLQTPEDFLNLLLTPLQAASTRNTTVIYDNISKKYKVIADPQGEIIIQNFQPTFPGGVFVTKNDVLTELNNISTFTGATGGEVFSLPVSEANLIFQDTTGKTLSVTSSPGSLFDIRPAFGIIDTANLDGSLNYEPFKFYIITLGQNDTFNFDLNTDPFNLTIAPGIYDDSGIISQLEAGFSGGELSEITYSDGYFAIVSNPLGKLWSTKSIQMAATSGPLVNVANALQSAILFVSAEDDEIVTPANTKIKIYKPDLRALVFRDDNTSTLLKILKILGFTPDARFETDTEEVTMDEISPFSVTLTENTFKVKYDNAVELDVTLGVAEALSGTEVSAIMVEALKRHLASAIIKDMFYATVYPLPIIGPPLADIPTYVNSFVSNTFIKKLENTVIDRLFSSINSELQNKLQISFPTDLDIPFITDSILQLNSIVNATFPAAVTKIGDKYIKDTVKLLISIALADFESNLPNAIDYNDISTALTTPLYDSITSAATSLLLPLDEDIKNEMVSAIMTEIESLFSSKYFFNTQVSFDTALASFTITSPSFGNISRVEVFPGDTNDITNHLGMDIGVETAGTGNVGLLHATTSEEVADIISAQGFQAFAFGSPAFRKNRQLFGVTVPPDYRYPHRYYEPLELPWSAEVYVTARSLNISSSASITISNVVGAPASEIGFPVGNITSIIGRSGFTGAFRQAGSFNPTTDTRGFVFVFVGVIALPDASPSVDLIKQTYNQVFGLIGFPKWE